MDFDHDGGQLRRASLEVLRAEAQDELGTVVLERLHAGEDPWQFMEEIPTIDELVVWTLRAELIRADGGRLPNAERDYRMLRQIALTYPALVTTCWDLIGRNVPAEARSTGPRTSPATPARRSTGRRRTA